MKAVVVYQSLWGNTAAIAHAIANGLGGGAKALSTTEATPDTLKDVELVVAGCPVHAFNLPSADTVKSAGDNPMSYGDHAPDTSQKLMRDWLTTLPTGLAAAGATFETGVAGPLGKGAARRIAKKMDRAGFAIVAKPHQFQVAMRTTETTRKGSLVDGELERAKAWGRELVNLVV